MYYKIKRCCISILYTLAIFPTSVIVLTFGVRLFYVCSNSFLTVAVVSCSIILAWYLGSKLQKIKRATDIALVVFFTSLIAGSIYLSISNCARCITPERFLNLTLRNSIAVAERNYNSSGFSYVSLCEDKTLLEIKNKIQSQMLNNSRRCYGPILNYLLPEKSVANLFVCNAGDESYAVEAYLHNKEKYACIDIRNEVIFKDISIGEATSCSN